MLNLLYYFPFYGIVCLLLVTNLITDNTESS